MLPVAALCLLMVGSRDRAFGLPPSLGPIQLGLPVVAGIVGWLAACGSMRPNRTTLGVALIAVAAAVLVPEILRRTTHDVVPSLRPALRLSLLAGVAVAVVVGAAIGRRRRAPPRPLDVVVALVVLGMVYIDQIMTHSIALRDLRLYLDAGRDFLAGGPVYTLVALTAAPHDPTMLPYVYPPPTLPLFALLAELPRVAVSAGWLILQVGAVVAAGRAIGLSWLWALAFLLWPPIFQGLFVGNVAIWMVFLFAVGPYWRVALGLLPIFKLQAAIASLWLVRAGHWRAVAVSAGIVVGIIVLTLPLVGISAWRDWWQALGAFQRTIVNLPSMGGAPVSRFYGETPALLAGGAILVSALWLRGRTSLASFGLASVALSPTLYTHGLALGLAGLLRLRAPVFWLVLCLTVNGRFQAQWILVLLVAAAAAHVRLLQHDPASDSARWQPLGSASGPWPAARWPARRPPAPPSPTSAALATSTQGGQPDAARPSGPDAVEVSTSRR